MLVVKLTITFALLTLLIACAENPVTGKKELSLMPLSQQISQGRSLYKPYQQQQGGLYIIDPDLQLYVSRVGRKLAALSDAPNLPYEFVVLNEGSVNAWALPGGKIAINRGLLLMLEDEAQLAAVLAHEIVHAAAGHAARQMTRATLLGLGAQALSSLGQATEYGALINQGVGLGAGAWNAKYGREDELQSDEVGIRYMIKAGYNPQAAVELQEKFVALSAGRSNDIFSNLFASHPPSQHRVDQNRAHAGNTSGLRNKKAFQQATRQLRKDAPAYKAHQAALKALAKKEPADKDYFKAIEFTKRAISLQPREAKFHITRGHLASWRDKHAKNAIASYAKAANLHPEYVMGYLYMGIAQHKQKQLNSAKQSLLKSLQVLPTPIAHFYLGETHLQLGDKSSASTHYNAAANDKGEIGNAARAKLAALGVQ